MKSNAQRYLRAINAIKQAKVIDSRANDKYSGMFLLMNIPNRMWVKGNDMVGSKALATRFTYEAAKKKKEELGLDLAIVDEHTDEIITDSCSEDKDISNLTLKEAKRLYEEGKISLGQLDDVAIRVHEESLQRRKEQHDSEESLTDESLDELIQEEEDAIASYAAAIAVCECPKAKETLTHIMNEEKEHVEELNALKELAAKDGGMRDYVYNIQHPDYGRYEKRHTPTPNQKAFEKTQKKKEEEKNK